MVEARIRVRAAVMTSETGAGAGETGAETGAGAGESVLLGAQPAASAMTVPNFVKIRSAQ